MAGNGTTPAAAKKAAAPRKTAASPVGVKDEEVKAHPLVGVAGVAEAVGGPRTALEQRAAIQKEYGQWVATAAITHDGALAYNVGDPVPDANVKAWNYDGLGYVARANTKAAAAAEEALETPDVTDPDADHGQGIG